MFMSGTHACCDTRVCGLHMRIGIVSHQRVRYKFRACMLLNLCC